jgi:hypothetical protein
MTRLAAAVWLSAAVPLGAVAQPIAVPVSAWVDDGAGMRVEGTYSVELALHDAETGGGALYTETRIVAIERGRFEVALGEGGTLDAAIFDGSPRWLEVRIDGAVLGPRLAIGSVPYALRAVRAGDAARLGAFVASDFARRVHVHSWEGLGIASVPAEAHSHGWSSLAAVPASFPPAPHGHAWSEIDGIPPGFADGVDAASSGDVSAVSSGSGLTGGATSGDALLGVGAIDTSMIADGSIGSAELMSSGAFGSVSGRVDGTTCFAGWDVDLVWIGNVVPEYGYQGEVWVVCPDADAGTLEWCSCPAGMVVNDIHYEDPSSDAVQADRIVRLVCVYPPF